MLMHSTLWAIYWMHRPISSLSIRGHMCEKNIFIFENGSGYFLFYFASHDESMGTPSMWYISAVFWLRSARSVSLLSVYFVVIFIVV